MGVRHFDQYLDRVQVTRKDIARALLRPESFALWPDADHASDMFLTWSLGPVIEHRDSDMMQRSNARALREYLESRPELADDWCLTTCGHWAVGQVTHLSYRVIGADGTAAPMLRVMLAWNAMLDVYPIADEDLLSEMEAEETSEAWETWQARDVRSEVVKILRDREEGARELVASPDDIEDLIDERISDETLWDLAHDLGEQYDGCLHLSSRDYAQIADEIESLLLGVEDTDDSDEESEVEHTSE